MNKKYMDATFSLEEHAAELLKDIGKQSDSRIYLQGGFI